MEVDTPEFLDHMTISSSLKCCFKFSLSLVCMQKLSIMGFIMTISNSTEHYTSLVLHLHEHIFHPVKHHELSYYH
jgi:hypothetical protein